MRHGRNHGDAHGTRARIFLKERKAHGMLHGIHVAVTAQTIPHREIWIMVPDFHLPIAIP
jgi:hypothetical protein